MMHVVRHTLLGLVCTSFASAAAAADEPSPAKPCATANECLARLDQLKNALGVDVRTAGLTLDGPARGVASRAVFLGGKAVLPRLAKLLSAKNDSVARAVAVTLGAAGPEAAASFPALARELNVKRATLQGRDLNSAIPWALAEIDKKRATPLLKAACQRGNVHAARVLLDDDPESFRAVVASSNPSEAVKMLTDDSLLMHLDPYLDESTRVPYLELAAKNPKLPAALKKSVAEILAERAKPSWRSSPVEAMAEIDRVLSDREMSAIDSFYTDHYSEAFRVVARAGRDAVALVPRLLAMLKREPVVAARATWALGEIPDPAARAAVKTALGSDDWRVVLVAANALGRQGAEAKDSADALARVAHWHPAVSATATAAAAAVRGKGPAPAPVEPLDGPLLRGPGYSWGETNEALGTGFRCTAAASWGKPTTTAGCSVPGELDKATACTSVQRIEAGSLRVEEYDRYALLEQNPHKLKLEFVPQRAESEKAITTVTQGYVMGVTGSGTRAIAVETERWPTSRDAQNGLGPGRTWLSRFERKGETWSTLPMVELPAGLADVDRLPDGSLRLDFPNSQLVLRVLPDGRIASGDCRPDPLGGDVPWVAMLQAVLDERGFVGRIEAGGIAAPLHVSFESATPAGAETLRFAGQPVVIEKDARTIDAGRTLHVWESDREHRPDEVRPWVSAPLEVMTLSVTYAVLQIEDRLRLAQERGAWKVLPPKKSAEELAATAPTVAPAPSDVGRPPRDALTTESGLAFKLLTPATGDFYDAQSPRSGSVVTVDVTAWTADGRPYFPTVGKAPARVQLPLALVIGGLAEGIVMMRTTEVRRLWIPARLAFAAPTAEQKDLVLDVRLIAVAEGDDEDVFLSTGEELAELRRPPRDLARPPSTAQTTTSGLAWRLLKKGKAKTEGSSGGETAALGYKAWTSDGSLFDRAGLGRIGYREGIELGTPLPLLIPGLAEGIRQMAPGNQYRLWIPPALAYGTEPLAPDVPAGPLVLDVDLTAR
jgi:FKBP-type peptidyl-prolyl cis-trans isomerase/HEAT repeat protein